MKLERLARVFEVKYGLISEAASPGEILARVKSDILNNYRQWVHGKYRALKILAEANEPYAKGLLDAYDDLIQGIDSYSPVQLFNRLNKVLGIIHTMKSDPDKTYRHSIHNSVGISRTTDQNFRTQLKSGFETNLKNISYGLEKLARTLRALIDKEAPLAGGAVEPQRKELSKDKILMFMRTPAAQTYGLDNLDVMTNLLQYPQLREKITTLINAIDRGHSPADGPEVMSETRAIKKWLDAQQATNLSALEQGPEKAAPPVSLLGDEEPEVTP
jgi:hypothetical protein